MARRRDQFFKVRQEAEQLLRELQIEALPVDPFAIAHQLDIELKPLPASAGGASGTRARGCTLRVDENRLSQVPIR